MSETTKVPLIGKIIGKAELHITQEVVVKRTTYKVTFRDKATRDDMVQVLTGVPEKAVMDDFEFDNDLDIYFTVEAVEKVKADG